MKHLSILLALFISQTAFAQKEWYFGMELGPKYDQFKKVKSKSSSSSSSIAITKDIGAVAGIKVGLNLDAKFAFESGIYRNNYIVLLEMSSSQKNILFKKEVVNTLNTYLIPLNFQMHFPLANEKQIFWFGGGLSLLMNPKTDFEGAFESETATIEKNGVLIDEMKYVRYEHQYEGSIYTFNLNTGLDIALFENVFLTMSLTGRFGIAGIDHFLVKLTDLEGESIYKISNNGSSGQVLVGFKYFLSPKSE